MRAICTSASLQASTGVSPGFTLFRHSSPPFGSKQAHSTSTHKGPGGVEHSFVCTPQAHSRLPFSTREVLATISSPLRVCLTPWSVFQDGWRCPISFANIEHHGEAKQLARRCHPLYLRPFHHFPNSCTCLPRGWTRKPPREDNAVGLVLTVEMEVLPVSLSRLQVLCHSLSKVLFKLSLTLLVRYRSSYFVFNLGRHIPAT